MLIVIILIVFDSWYLVEDGSGVLIKVCLLENDVMVIDYWIVVDD